MFGYVPRWKWKEEGGLVFVMLSNCIGALDQREESFAMAQLSFRPIDSKVETMLVITMLAREYFIYKLNYLTTKNRLHYRLRFPL